MARRSDSSGESKRTKSRIPSPGAGGPATFTGTTYQVNYAISLSLDLISLELAVPTSSTTIAMEPRRFVDGDGTAWDLRIGPPEVQIELKHRPARVDVLEFADRLARAGVAPELTFRFVYSHGGGRTLHALSILRRLSREAGTGEEFDVLAQARSSAEMRELLDRLGPDSYRLLRSLELEAIPNEVLRRQVDLTARMMAGEDGGQQLREMLFQKFSEGSASRQSYRIRDLILEIRGAGILLQTPPSVRAGSLERHIEAVLVSLQACPSPLPLQVLADSTGFSEESLLGDLAPLLRDGIVAYAGNLIAVAPLPGLLNPEGRVGALRNTLDAYLAAVETKRIRSLDRSQLVNLHTLATACLPDFPTSVARVFHVVDKHLKNVGDKHLCLEVANLSIGATKQSARTTEMVEHEAQALICGRSWVYQRVGRLTEARAAGERSLRLAVSIDSPVSIAWGHKCIGRLLRMEAEELTGSERQILLEKSEVELLEAIREFSAAARFGPTHPEVGDCYSLLGRTYLVANKRWEAEEAVSHAFSVLFEDHGKDYVDLLILDGDLKARFGSMVEAHAQFGVALALAGDPNTRSELRARALVALASSSQEQEDRQAGIRYLERAIDEYDALREIGLAAAARWDLYRANGKVPADALDLLRGEPPLVRSAAIAVHEERLSRLNGGVRGRRSVSPGRPYWEQVLGEARMKSAQADVDW